MQGKKSVEIEYRMLMKLLGSHKYSGVDFNRAVGRFRNILPSLFNYRSSPAPFFLVLVREALTLFPSNVLPSGRMEVGRFAGGSDESQVQGESLYGSTDSVRFPTSPGDVPGIHLPKV